jgi:hypothetical protein
MPIKTYRDADSDGRADSALSMSEIKTEHGGDSDPSLREYYRNENFMRSTNFDRGFNNNYSAGIYALKDPSDPNNKMIVRAEPVENGPILDYGVINAQPGGSGVITDGTTEREAFVDTVHVEGTGNATTGKYRVKTRIAENSFVPQSGQSISFSDLYGTTKESTPGYSFDASIGKLYITVTKDRTVSNMDHNDNDFLLDEPGSQVGKTNFIPLVTAKDLLQISGIYQDKPDEVNQIEFFIPKGTVVYSPDSNRPAFDIDGIPSRISILLNLGGRIVGGGGDGGDAQYDGASDQRNGKNGSTGLRVNHDGKFRLNVTSDSDYAICGGGGGGAAGYYRYPDGKDVGAGGGGGAGRSLGGSARFSVEEWSKSAYKYNANITNDPNKGPDGVTNHVKWYPFRNTENLKYWDRLETGQSLVDRFVEADLIWGDRESNYSTRTPGYAAGRVAKSSNAARATTTGYEEINSVVRARQTNGGGGAGGSMISKTNPQWHGVNLPYTKPDYIHELNDFFTREPPEFVDDLPEGFTNGWIIEHIDGTNGGYYCIVEDSKIIYSDYAYPIRNLKAIGLEAQDNYGKSAYKYGMRLAQTFTGTRQLQDAEVTRSWIWYERVDYTDDGSPEMQPNQSNYDDFTGFRAGTANPPNPPYYHGGGFTKSNGTTSSGDVHKYLYYPVKKFDQGIVRMFFPNGSTTISNGWPPPNSDQVSGVTVGSGANGSVRGNPSSTNLSYPTAIPSNGNGERRMHASYTDLSIGGYGGCTKSPNGGDSGIGYSLLAPPTFPGTSAAGDLRRTYQTIYGGGGGGGDFGARGGDADGIHWSGPNGGTATSYKAYGGMGGFAIDVNKEEHLLTDGGASSVPEDKTHGRIVIAGQTDIFSAVMTVGYNTHKFSYATQGQFEAGYGGFSTFPGSSKTVQSPFGSLSNGTDIVIDGDRGTIAVLKATGYSDGSNRELNFTVWGMSNYEYNGGWETLQIGGSTFRRSDAKAFTSSSYVGGRSWVWDINSNPFGSTRGATKNISIG